MKKKCFQKLGLLLLVLFSISAFSQDRAYVHKIVSDLASPQMFGRGYVKNGDRKAAQYLQKEMKKIGLMPFFENYEQAYEFSIQTHPGKLKVRTDAETLLPGQDFVINAATQSIDKTFQLVWLPDTITQLSLVYTLIDTTSPLLIQQMIVVPAGLKNVWRNGIPGVKSLIQREKGPMWWHVSRKQLQEGSAILKIVPEKLPPNTTELHIKLQSKFEKAHSAVNVAGFVKGSTCPDSLIVFVAHYDHLGMMGNKTIFPGASDNASGTAFVLDLAKYYASHPEKAFYTMAFILVSGEEAGLLGSRYFTDHAPFELDKVLFAINFDMVGTGSEGITVVNAKQFPNAFSIIQNLNSKNNYLSKVVERGESCNSDHCPFYEKGVPSFFIHTQGPENQHYHTIYDKAANLPFTKHEAFFSLITAFVEQIKSSPVNKK
jgi:hypothetical protein